MSNLLVVSCQRLLLPKRKMEEEQKAETGGSTPAPAKANGKRKVKKDFEEENTPDKVPIILSSSSNSHNHVNNGAKSESSEEEEQRQVEVSGEKDVVDDSVEAEDAANSTDASNKKKKAKKEVKEDKNQKKKKRKEEIEEKESSSLYQIPMNRVSRIIKSEDPNIRISQEAVFIINKASEKFLQLFTTEAYASAFLDRKKHIDYKHLSSVISKRRRFDFLSDFVPEKVKAEDALKESSPTVET